MTQILWLTGEEKVLEIGTGSGYQTAILAELARDVYTIERISNLSSRAEQLLNILGYGNIHFKTGDGTLGWREAAPFDRILITAAAPRVPQALLDQLAIGGRIIAPVGSKIAQELQMIAKKKGDRIQTINRGGCIFVPLIGQDGWKDD